LISQCANPDCRAPFVYLREGRLAVVHHNHASSPHLEFFWLCGECASRLRFQPMIDGGMRVVPVAPEFTADRPHHGESHWKFA
jgi:hypothetical protein